MTGLALVGALLGWLLDAWRAEEQKADTVAGVVAALLAVPAVLVLLVNWWRWGVAARDVPGEEKITQAADVLIGQVNDQYTTEAVQWSLDDPDPMPVRWKATVREELTDHPANLTPGVSVEGSSDAIADLADDFRAMRRRRLVILGGPGAGKTTLAVQLLRHLLKTRQEGEPVPVLVSAAEWDTTRHSRIQEWMTAELERGYPALRTPGFGEDMPRLLVTRGRILPVLDGLDELPDQARTAVIAALNRSLADSDQVILTSRTDEYADAVTAAAGALTSALVIQPVPLDPAAAADYLERCLPPRPAPAWHQILAELCTPEASDTALGKVTTTPLGLWLVRTVFLAPQADPTPLTDQAARFPTAATLRAHLFDHLVEALVNTRKPSDDPATRFRPRRRYAPAQVRSWLGYLAHHLTAEPTPGEGQGIRDFSWWRLAATTHAITRSTARTLALLTPLVVGLPVGFALALVVGLVDGLAFGFSFGLAFGLLDGVVVWLTATSWPRDEPGYADLRIHQRSGELVQMLVQVYKSAVGLSAGFVGGLVGGLVSGFPGGLTVGFMVWLVVGFTAWAETPTKGSQATTPMGSWHADRALNLFRLGTPTLVVWLVVGLPVGLVLGFGGGLVGLVVGLVEGLAFGLVIGPAIGVGAGRHRAWLAYLVATWRLARAGRLPRRLMRFLDDCHRLGLLRTVGPVYQFRHAELHDHLAAAYQREHQ